MTSWLGQGSTCRLHARHCVCVWVYMYVSPAYAQLEIFKLTNKLCALRPPKLAFERHPKDSMAWQRQQSAKWDTKHPQRVLEGGETFPQATSTPLALGVNVLGDADLSPVIYKRQCDEGEWQVQPGRLLTIATQLSGDVGSAFIHRQRGKPLWES